MNENQKIKILDFREQCVFVYSLYLDLKTPTKHHEAQSPRRWKCSASQ